VKSVHVRRLESRIARTAARFAEHAARTGCTVADLRNVRLPWYEIRAASDAAEPDSLPEGSDTPTILIYEEIGGSFGVDADTFARDLMEIDAPEILVRLNSPGGSLWDGIAIYNALNAHPARIVVQVDSLAASIASVIAMAGDEVIMMPGSQMMIHDAGMTQDGNAEDMAKASTFLDRQSANVADIYRLRAGGDVQTWRDLMLEESWLFAAEAVELGLADRVMDPPAKQTPADPEDRMTRAHDLTGFRYAGRAAAPAPGRGSRVKTHRRSRGGVQTTARADVTAQTDARSAALARARTAEVTDAGLFQRSVRAADAPSGNARMLAFPTELRAKLVDFKGKQMHRLEGYATVFGRAYDMWDAFGPYRESVNAHALDRSLAAGPDVAFLVNHKGVTMARTTNGTLTLTADAHGLHVVAYLNPDRQDVRDLISAITDELVTEMSFAFQLDEGVWNDDFTEFDITGADIDRGDVSGVNYGASPYTSIAARSRELITHDLDRLPTGAARAALSRLQQRADLSGGVPSAELASQLTQAMGWFTSIDWIVGEARDALAGALGVPNTDDAAGQLTLPTLAAVGAVGFDRDSTPIDAGRPEPEPQTCEPEPAAPTFAVRPLDDVAAWLADAEAHKATRT
jgi:HK97 family phage prohead protease